MKRFVALMLVAVLVVGICATAFAATKPTASYNSVSRNQKVKRGKTVKIIFNIDSKGYTSYVKNRFYAAFDMYVCRGSKNGPRVTSTVSRMWSGKYQWTHKIKTNKSDPAGKYTHVLKLYYRNSIYSNWLLAKTKSLSFTLK